MALSLKASLWIGPGTPILASRSAIRRQLIENAGIPLEVEAAEVDERRIEAEFLRAGGAPARLASHLARAKALAVSERRPQAMCFGADQTLRLGDVLVHKSRDLEEADQNLRSLAGRTHVLNAAICVARGGAILFEASESAELTMRPLDDDARRIYLSAAGPEILASVGAYQIEKLGIHLFEAIKGDHATILGLPLGRLLAWLRSNGFLAI